MKTGNQNRLTTKEVLDNGQLSNKEITKIKYIEKEIQKGGYTSCWKRYNEKVNTVKRLGQLVNNYAKAEMHLREHKPRVTELVDDYAETKLAEDYAKAEMNMREHKLRVTKLVANYAETKLVEYYTKAGLDMEPGT